MSTLTRQDILFKYRDALLERMPDAVQRLVLFGSQARGDASTESDIDVLVIVNWEEERLPGGFYAAPFTDARWQIIVDIASDLSLEYGVYLSPLVMSEQRFQEWSPITQRLKEEGKEIWKKSKN